MKSSVLCYVLIVICGGVLLTYNAQRLIGAPAIVRTKDLEFMPTATTYRLLSYGHTNTLAKLRWVDSFSYILLQIDKRDDALIGFQHGEGAGGFERLYRALIELDPYFDSYYHYASLGASLGSDNKDLAIYIYQLGTHYLPDEMAMWQGLLASLKTYKGYSLKAMNSVLAAWFDSTTDENTQRLVLRWKKFHEKQTYSGLENVYFWAQKISTHAANSVIGETIDATLRAKITEFHLEELNELAEKMQQAPVDIQSIMNDQLLAQRFATTGTLPMTFAVDYVLWGPFEFSQTVYAQLMNTHSDGKRVLRCRAADMRLNKDPYGFEYQIRDGKFMSLGLQRYQYESQVLAFNYHLGIRATDTGRWPKDTPEALEWIKDYYVSPPAGMHVHYARQQLSLSIDQDSTRVLWDLRTRSREWASIR